VKLDTSGAILWQNTIGGNSTDILNSIQQTIDGGYVLGGWSNSNSWGDKTENSQGGVDYWVVKLDASGAIQWQNTIGGSDDDILYSIQQTSDGGYVLGGSSVSNISGDKTENSQGADDYWVVKLDASGALQWQNTIGGSSYDYLRSIQQTSDGGYVLGGFSWSDSTGNKTENSQGGLDYWVVKLCGADLTYTSQSIICEGDSALIFSIYQSTAGTYYNTLTNINGCDSIIAAILTVNQLPTVNLGADTMICNGCSITLDAGAGFTNYDWLTGESTQTINVDSAGTYIVEVIDANGCVGGDTIVVDIASGVGELSIDENINIYPNPNTGQFILEMDLQKNTSISIKLYQITGQFIFKEDISNANGIYSQQIDLSNHAKGMYYVQIVTNNKVFTKKVIYQ